MLQFAEELRSIFPVQIGGFQRALLGVRPVDAVVARVQGESVGPPDVRRDEHLAIGAVQRRPFDLRLVAPIRPK